MSVPGGSNTDLTEDGAVSPAAPTAEPQVVAVSKKPEEENSQEEKKEITYEEEEEDEEEDEEEEEMSRSAHLEPSTLPWPGDKRPPTDHDDGVWSEKDVSEGDERDMGISGGSQDLSEEQSQVESDRKAKAKWRESMPEGERWRDDDDEIEVHRQDRGDGSLADDEEEEEEEEEEDGDNESEWISEKAAPGFTPHVMIVSPSGRGELRAESRSLIEKEVEREPQMEPDSAVQIYPEWMEEDDKFYVCEHVCSEKVRLVLATVAAGLLFPLLVWGGYVLLPFDSPVLGSTPLRVLYTLRCSFFAMIPIMLGMMVQGLARLRYSALKPLYQSEHVHRQVAVHWHYINESLALFLFYFLQLAVMSTYISQDLIKLVPLLTIVFVFGRLIYWLCLSLGSTIRAFGFGFSFFPILVMLGTNLFFICASVGPDSVFDVAPPTTAPPPRQRWWG